jgi:hypothetical protein
LRNSPLPAGTKLLAATWPPHDTQSAQLSEKSVFVNCLPVNSSDSRQRFEKKLSTGKHLLILKSDSLTTMKLNDLIKSYSWLSIELTLLRLYPDQETMLDDYRNVFGKLKLLEPQEDDMIIVLTEIGCDPDDEGDANTYVDVSGRKKEEDPQSMTVGYAIEFVEWEKWLGMDLAPETTKNFPELEIIAHCLYEMTFISFDDRENKEQFNTIHDRVEDYKKLTKEEIDEKTITLDELMRRLNMKGTS